MVRVKGTKDQRVWATSGKHFFGLIMESVGDVEKMRSGRVEVKFGSTLFELEGGPDWPPRSETQKQGGKITNTIFGAVTLLAQKIGYVGAPALGSYRKDSENGIHRRQLMLEPTVVDDSSQVLPLFDLVYLGDGSFVAAAQIDETTVYEHKGYQYWRVHIMVAMADVNTRLGNREVIAKRKINVLFDADVATPPPITTQPRISFLA